MTEHLRLPDEATATAAATDLETAGRARVPTVSATAAGRSTPRRVATPAIAAVRVATPRPGTASGARRNQRGKSYERQATARNEGKRVHREHSEPGVFAIQVPLAWFASKGRPLTARWTFGDAGLLTVRIVIASRALPLAARTHP
jgi:hypothetical protein